TGAPEPITTRFTIRTGDPAMPATPAVARQSSDVRRPTVRTPFQTTPGRAHPLGATVAKDGVNFSVFSRNPTSVDLLPFDPHDDLQPSQIINPDPQDNRTFYFWPVYVKDLKPGTHYAYRVDGPEDLHGRGFRFNRNKVLVDPYALGNSK